MIDENDAEDDLLSQNFDNMSQLDQSARMSRGAEYLNSSRREKSLRHPTEQSGKHRPHLLSPLAKPTEEEI